MIIQFKEYMIPFRADYISSKDVASIEIDSTQRSINIISLDSVLYVIPMESVLYISDKIEPPQVKTRTRGKQ